MKNTRKNKANIYKLLVILIIVAIITGVSGVYNQITGNLETKGLKASSTNSTLSVHTLLEEALNLTNQREYGYNCNGFVESAIHRATGNTGVAPVGGTTNWYNGAYSYTYNGTTYTVDTPIFTGTKPGGTTWYNAYNSSSETIANYIDAGRILPGDVVVGTLPGTSEGHMFMYLGKANTYNELMQNLQDSGVNVPNNVYNIARNVQTQAGGIYWYIEGNVNASDTGWGARIKGTAGNYNGIGNTYNIPCVTNYNWQEQVGQSGNMYNIRVFRVSVKKNGKYNISIGKKDIDTESYLSGAVINTRFNNDNTGRGEANGKVIDVTTTSQKSYLNTNFEWNANSQNYVDVNTSEADVYAFKEVSAPSGYKANIYSEHICVEVFKKMNAETPCIDGIKLYRGQGRNQSYVVMNYTQATASNKTWYLQYNNDNLSVTETKPEKSVLVGEITLGANGSNLDFNFYNEEEQPEQPDQPDQPEQPEQPTGFFDIKLVKYEKDTEVPLANATFEIIVEKSSNGVIIGQPIANKIGVTDSEGRLDVEKIAIRGENETYHVSVYESASPLGYVKPSNKIEFDVTTVKVGNEYKLVKPGNGDIVVENTKKVHIEPNEILIELENRKTQIDIHKGVKTVENQDSGYFYKDTNSNSKAENENNLEISSSELNHKWVVETTIPENVTAYNKYIVKDPIDLTKLDFAGTEMVTVERVDSKGKVLETLTKDKDYKLSYTQDLGVKKGYLTVTYINKKGGNNFIGDFLTAAGISSRPEIENTKIRLTFYTTFKVNEDGKLAVLDGTISNAENKSNLIYDNGNNEEISKESETPEVHTGAVSVFKYEDTNGNKKHDEDEKALVGAEFKIAATEEDAKNGKFISINGEELTAVTNEHGIATFTGLEFGGDAKDSSSNLNNGLYNYNWEKASREYYLVETKTPEGYEKIEDIIKVTVSKNSSQIIDLTEKIDEMESVGNKPMKFDLALRKWVTEAIVTENGKTVVYKTGHKAEDNPEDVVKVDLKKSKLKDITVKFKYSIRVTNEGQIEGEAQEITDYIPEGLKFVKEDNPDWETTDDERVVKTDKLKGVTLKNNESAEVEIILTWVNSEKNMGKMTNTAEISKDYNEYNVHDIDSTPNNKKADEDDIDIAEVMLSVKTGSEILSYIVIGVGFFVVIMVGVGIIRKKFLV